MKMDAKAYLQQVMNIDQQINSRLEQLGRLKTLATHTTSTISDMPKAQGSVSRMEDTVIKIITMEHEIDDEIDKLVDLKVEVRKQISLMEDARCRLILEERYLNGQTWEGIAADLGYTVRNVQILHGKALQEFQVPEKYDETA
jgi:DNA-directed RNA polymerase specialized sigma subunit